MSVAVVLVGLHIASGGVARAAQVATDAVPAFVCDSLDSPTADFTFAATLPLIVADQPVLRERLMCVGNPLTDDPSCWPDAPGNTPQPTTILFHAFDDVALTAALPFAHPTPVRVPFVAVVIGASQPGFARGIDRPPRLA
jgi:hypothetical protein